MIQYTKLHLNSLKFAVALAAAGLALSQCSWLQSDAQTKLFKDASEGKCKKLNWYTRKGASLKKLNDEGLAAVHLAAAARKTQCLQRFLTEEETSFEIENTAGNTPLFIAVQSNNTEAIKLLLEKKVNLQHKNKNNQGIFEYAWEVKQDEAISLLRTAGLYHPQAYQWFNTGIATANLALVADGVKGGARVNYIDKENSTALMKAAEKGYYQIVKFLAESGANLNYRKVNGETAVSIAFAGGHEAVARYLIARGASNPVAEKKLFEAATKGDIDMIDEALKEGAHVNAFDAEGTSAFLKSVRNDKAGAARHLIDKKANVNLADRDGYTALHWCAQKKEDTLLKLVLSQTPELNTKNKFGYTPLILAASEGYLENVMLLVEAGSDFNIEADRGGTAAYWAKENDHKKVLKYLLDKGAIDPNSNEALTDAIKAGDIQAVKTALAARVNVNARNRDGYSPIMFAANKGNLEVLQMLVQKGANVNVQEAEGYTPLMMAAWHSHLPALRALMAAGATQSLLHNKGRSALMIAAWKGSSNVLAELLQNPYEINRQDKEGYTALMFAVLAGSSEKVSMLIAKGANRGIKNYAGVNAAQIASSQNRTDLAALIGG